MSFFLIIPALIIVGIYSAFEFLLYGVGIVISLLSKRIRMKRLDRVYLNVVTLSFIRVICVFVVIALFELLNYWLFRDKQGFWNDFYYQASQAPIIFIMIFGLIIDLSIFLYLLLGNKLDKKMHYFLNGITIISSIFIGTASVMIAYIVTVWAS